MLGCCCDPIANNAGCGEWMSPTINAGVRYVVDSACLMHGTASWMTMSARMGLSFRYVPSLTDEERNAETAP